MTYKKAREIGLFSFHAFFGRHSNRWRDCRTNLSNMLEVRPNGEDCKLVDDEMSECSRWIRGHDQAAADGTPFPKPSALQIQIDILEKWTKQVRARRK